MRDAGIIGFIPRGEYSPTETYDFLQFVYYGDSTYVAKKETTGNTPAENNEYWQLLAKGRAVGVTGVKGSSESEYRTGDVNITAGNVGALPLSGGTVGTNEPVPFYIKNDGDDNTAIGFKNKGINLGNINMTKGYFQIFSNNMTDANGRILFRVSPTSRQVYDKSLQSMKDILIDVAPTVKETKLLASNGGFKVYGNDTSHDITDIFVKANTVTTEGVVLGKTTNRIGYIIGQNFNLDCTRLTDSERTTLQSYNKIIIYKENNSIDYPSIVPSTQDIMINSTVTCKTGYKNELIKVSVSSNNTRNQILYNIPSSFTNDDNSQNNLRFSTNYWVEAFGVNVKDY